MIYGLDEFTTECRAVLKAAQPLDRALPMIAESLARLLADRDFVSATFNPDDTFARKPLYHDPDTGFHVLAHVHQGPKEGPPHSHGASWAIYGTAFGVTGMKEWRRINPSSEPAAVLQLADRYDLATGQTRGYGPDLIHSTVHQGKAGVIRVTGANLDVLPRYRFDKKRDRIATA